MHLSITFNWPIGQDSASVEIGRPNIVDKEFEFRIGVVVKDRQDKIGWYKAGWLSHQAIENERINFFVKRDDVVIVEKRTINSSGVSRFEWKIVEKWPSEACGEKLTVIGWDF